ncbi:PilW family protein [Psychrobacter ciconiae]|uniref:PilW family protein n=1 Tax=Psychrobacter ciconiae TaxID=1553449 RepID=UPI0019182D8D|nr:PilW family protein [Psychrobacter ciconiae]
MNKSIKITSPLSHQGFTLIELMISLVLGLLISAAVMQVYLINTRTLTVQQSASEVQDSSIFAIQSLESHIRLANLGNPINYITDETNHGGIVLTKNNLGASNNTDPKYFTINSANGLSNINNQPSDQLTIQYKNITPYDLFDCEGTKIVKGSTDWVVERYFVRLATGATAKTGINDLVLACSSGRVDTDGNVIAAFTGNGQVMVEGVDQFKILLGAQSSLSQLNYLAPSIYTEIDKPETDKKAALTSIKLGMIVHSNTPLIDSTDTDQFVLLGVTQKLKDDNVRKKYYRRSYETTVLLRSARVMTIISKAS